MFGKKDEWVEFSFSARNGGPMLRARLNVLSKNDAESPVVFMATGDGKKGASSSSWTNIPPMLAKVGLRTFLFDFEGLGHSDGERRSLTLSKGVQNLETAFNFLRTTAAPRSKATAAFASSFGAACLLLAPKVANAMRAIVLKSPAPFLPQAYFNEIGPSEFKTWCETGYSEKNGYSIEVLDDAFRHDVWAVAQQVTSPVLITHGTADEIVPYAHSELLRSRLAGKVDLVSFSGAGHGYSEGDAWSRMAETAVKWLKAQLV